nr:hypothetical protein [Tanacetum cinerariifolium]
AANLAGAAGAGRVAAGLAAGPGGSAARVAAGGTGLLRHGRAGYHAGRGRARAHAFFAAALAAGAGLRSGYGRAILGAAGEWAGRLGWGARRGRGLAGAGVGAEHRAVAAGPPALPGATAGGRRWAALAERPPPAAGNWRGEEVG